jgi:hypothetical protein
MGAKTVWKGSGYGRTYLEEGFFQRDIGKTVPVWTAEETSI